MKPKPFDARVVVLMTKDMKEKLQILAGDAFDDEGGATLKMGRYVRLCIRRMWDERERKEGIG